MASGGKKQQDDEGSGSWLWTGLKIGAALGAAALTTYAAVKMVEPKEKEESPMTRRYSGDSFKAPRGHGYPSSSSSAWAPREVSYCAPEGFPEASTGGPKLEEEEPWCLFPGKLEYWYNEHIQLGTEDFAIDCRSAIDKVVKHVHKHCSSNILDFDVDKVVKGGSLGKGTMVKELSDVDLVAFVNKPYLQPIAEIGKEEYKNTLSRIISDLTSTLQDVQNVKVERVDGYLVNFKIEVGRRWIDVDLLPTAHNILSHQSSYHEMFRAMLDVGHGTRQYYSASFVQNQVTFVRKQPGHVKELIRLVKYWAYKFLPKKLQKSYPLELITIHLWEKAGKPGRRMSKAEGLKSVMEVLTNLEQLCVSWEFLHSDENFALTVIRRLDMKRPILLDPANPTNNVCYNYQWSDNMQVIAKAAERTLQTALLRKVDAWPN